MWDKNDLPKKHPSTPDLLNMNMEAALTFTHTLHTTSQKKIQYHFFWHMTPCHSIIGFRYFEGTVLVRNIENKLTIFQKNAVLKIHGNLKDREKKKQNWSLIFLLDNCDMVLYYDYICCKLILKLGKLLGFY